jgi:Lrp/AsnC family transcriptional regulator
MHRYDQIIEVYRITGHEIDYLLKIVSPSIEKYDEFQQNLIKEFEFKGMATKIVLKEIKKVNSLPLDHI